MGTYMCIQFQSQRSIEILAIKLFRGGTYSVALKLKKVEFRNENRYATFLTRIVTRLYSRIADVVVYQDHVYP